MSLIDTYSVPLKDLYDKRINYTQFLERVGMTQQYKKWCKEHHLNPCDENAEIYFDMHGFAESEVVKEIIEPGS